VGRVSTLVGKEGEGAKGFFPCEGILGRKKKAFFERRSSNKRPFEGVGKKMPRGDPPSRTTLEEEEISHNRAKLPAPFLQLSKRRGVSSSLKASLTLKGPRQKQVKYSLERKELLLDERSTMGGSSGKSDGV